LYNKNNQQEEEKRRGKDNGDVFSVFSGSGFTTSQNRNYESF
jgi:hypothetical protein